MPPHTDQVLESFDNVADIFDEEFENEITRRLRKTIYGAIDSLVPAGASILDINCGTGIDAIALARKGYNVVGADLAPKMIEHAQRKCVEEPVPARFLVCSFDRLDPVAKTAFDLVLSNFGGLNCTQRLDTVAEQAASVTKPGGYFVGVVMPRLCLWETAAGLSRFDFRAAFRRLRRNVAATGFRGKTFDVHYHSPARLARAFEPWFDLQSIRGLNILSPPPHAARLAQRYPGVSALLERMDDAIAHLPACRSIGDHYAVILKRHVM